MKKDPMKINEGFLAQLREATKLLQSEGPMAATAAIQRALHETADTDDNSAMHDAQPQMPDLKDLLQRTMGGAFPTGGEPAAKTQAGARKKWKQAFAHMNLDDVIDVEVHEPAHDAATGGRFVSASCSTHAGTRAYKLYIPSSYKDEPLPLVVMLHGCTQNPDDFAAGTGMNRLAEEFNCLVAYPEQNRSANANQCWNWFEPGHQQRERGEPAILAQITRQIAQQYKVDANRVYAAGLSAGGAMAAVLAATYPDLFAAVGIHSGLPYGIARDVPSAFAAMKRGKSKSASFRAKVGKPSALRNTVPAIVFHGDRDATVHLENADQALAQCVPASANGKSQSTVQKGSVPNGRSYTRTVVHDEAGRVIGEKWVVHGAGHAWAGGNANGSYTDPRGPSAAREMLRFFGEHRLQGKA